MKNQQLIDLLKDFPQDEDVVIEVRTESDDNIEDGDILEITDDRSVLFSLGAIHILADYVMED
jgi:hypothetical protein